MLIAAVAAPMYAGEPRLDDWPIRPAAWAEGNHRDAEQAAFVADLLRFDQVDWLGILFRADRRSRERRYRSLVVAIADALERTEVLFQPELEAIAARVAR